MVLISIRLINTYFLDSAAVAGASAGEEEDALPTYKEAFPPLPEKAASPEGTQETANAWTSKIRPLKSSIITQVYHCEELNPLFSNYFFCCSGLSVLQYFQVPIKFVQLYPAMNPMGSMT